MQTRWSEIIEKNKDIDENRASICGFYLNCLGVDLMDIPDSIMVPCAYYETDGKRYDKPSMQKVYLDSIVGTSYKEYAGGTWLETMLRLHRADRYIKKGMALRGKYFRLMKQKQFVSDIPSICLSRDKIGKCYIDGNGNHRVTFYKLMQYTDGMMYRAAVDQQFHVNDDRNRHMLYWLYAMVKDEV